jgi:hypothetical protein
MTPLTVIRVVADESVVTVELCCKDTPPAKVPEFAVLTTVKLPFQVEETMKPFLFSVLPPSDPKPMAAPSLICKPYEPNPLLRPPIQVPELRIRVPKPDGGKTAEPYKFVNRPPGPIAIVTVVAEPLNPPASAKPVPEIVSALEPRSQKDKLASFAEFNVHVWLAVATLMLGAVGTSDKKDPAST